MQEQTNSCFLKGLNMPGSPLAQVFMCSLYLAAGWEVVGGRKETETPSSGIRSKLIIKQRMDWGSLLPLVSVLKEARGKQSAPFRRSRKGDARCARRFTFLLFWCPHSRCGGVRLCFSEAEVVPRGKVTCSGYELDLGALRFQTQCSF